MKEYQEIYNQVNDLIKQKKNIILIGSGNNGKTYLINELRPKLLSEKYSIVHEYNYQKIENPYIIEINNILQINNDKLYPYELIDMNHIVYKIIT